MARDQGRVEIDREPLGRAGQCPHALTRASARDPQARQAAGIMRDPVDHPKRRRRRGHVPEQRLLLAQRAEVGQAVAAVGEHHREIADDTADVMATAAPTQTAELDRQRTRQAGLIATRASSALPACETNPSPSGVTSTVKRRPARVTFKVILPSRSFRLQHPEESLLRRAVKRPRPTGPLLLHARSGLETWIQNRRDRCHDPPAAGRPARDARCPAAYEHERRGPPCPLAAHAEPRAGVRLRRPEARPERVPRRVSARV